MRPTLILQPIHTSSASILKAFSEGKPLTNDQHEFLRWHENQLSNEWYDPILHYYLHSKRPQREYHGTFLLPHEEMNLEAIQSLKKRILASLKNKFSHAVININQKQFLSFKQYTINELIFWHGNQFLTGSSFYPGGIPPVIYFQWGNLFGVVKYLVLSDEKALKANILIYFEDLQDRTLDECVKEYQQHVNNEIQLQNELVNQKKLIHPELKHETPKMTPSHYFLADHL